MKYLIPLLLLIAIGLNSCLLKSSKNDNNKQELLKWYGKEILLPKKVEIKSNLKVIKYPALFNAKYKILVYIDSNGCIPCRLALSEWRELIKETQQLNRNITYLFYISLNKYDLFEQEILSNQFKYPVIYDRYDKINRLNHFSPKQQFHIFLLNDKNKVLLVGSPIGNPQLKKLYIQQMSK
jgi:hypothetical protein